MHDVALESRDSNALHDEVARLRATIARLEDKVVELDRLAHLDPLVGVMNRRGLMRELDAMIARHDRQDLPASVLFVDLDALKSINDRHGHAVGDAALVKVAQLLLHGVRICDSVARLGGDEFCVLLERSDESSARDTAERLVQLVANAEFNLAGERMPLSISVGITQLARGDTPHDVLARADRAMYRVKAVA